MNRYGRAAQTWWSNTDPARVAELDNPTKYFTQLGEQVESRVDELMQTMQGSDEPGESVLQKAGRINAVKMQAEEIAYQELIYTIESHPATVDEDLEQLQADRPSPARVQELLQQLEENEPEMSTDEYEERKAYLTSLQTQPL